jgi:hypothetical protein
MGEHTYDYLSATLSTLFENVKKRVVPLNEGSTSFCRKPLGRQTFGRHTRHQKRYVDDQMTSGLYYKTITIVLMTIVSDTTIWSITYRHY